MSLFSESRRTRQPHRPISPIFLPADYADWPDRIFLMYVRDRLLWVHNDETDLANRLSQIIHSMPMRL